MSIVLPFIIITLASMPIAVTPTKPKKLVIELIHRNSIHSPYHNPKGNAVMKSISTARFAYLQAKIRSRSRSVSTFTTYQPDIFPLTNYSLFFMNFSIGQPPIPQFTIMDTGSSLLWIQCVPCISCSSQFSPVFDPAKSSTYKELSCYSQYCTYAPGDGNKCNFFDKCKYEQKYHVTGLKSTGILSMEKLIFKDTETPSNVLFGCSHDNGNFKDRQLTGVFGLGFEKTSLVSQLGSSFSYCVGNLNDPYYPYNKLILGDGAIIEGDSTPLEVINGNYYVNLEGISVGDKRLDIDPDIFRRKCEFGTDGVVIDSGADTTWLVKTAYEALSDEVQLLLNTWLTRYNYDAGMLCYEGIISRDLVGFPIVTFHFAGGADLVLDINSLFYQEWPHAFCMAVFSSSGMNDGYTGLSLIGMMAQQNYNVAYDLAQRKLSFQMIDCELLDET